MNPGASQCAAGQPGGKRTIFRLSPPNLVEASPLARNVARIKMLSILEKTSLEKAHARARRIRFIREGTIELPARYAHPVGHRARRAACRRTAFPQPGSFQVAATQVVTAIELLNSWTRPERQAAFIRRHQFHIGPIQEAGPHLAFYQQHCTSPRKREQNRLCGGMLRVESDARIGRGQPGATGAATPPRTHCCRPGRLRPRAAGGPPQPLLVGGDLLALGYRFRAENRGRRRGRVRKRVLGLR
jgi:hypothetical protein